MKVSVVIPVYNAEAYLNDCLNSLLAQSLRDFEVICVDDGATDQSAAILASLAREEPRLRLIRQENRGTLIARKRGVEAATGEFIVFVDPDDTVDRDYLRLLVAEAEKGSWDIVQCGVNLIETRKRSRAQRRLSERYFNPSFNPQTEGNILNSAYLARHFGWNLIFRLFKADLVKQAFASLPEVNMINETDAAAFFFIARLAKSICRIPERLYHYRYGEGISTTLSYTTEAFIRTLGKFDYLRLSEPLLAQREERLAFVALAGRMFENSLKALTTRLAAREDRQQAVDAFRAKMDFFPRQPVGHPKRIGLLYFHLTPGGVQRVISLILPQMMARGETPVLILERPLDENSYQIPKGVAVRYLPVSTGPHPASHVERIEALSSLLAEEQLDLVYSHESVADTTLWDLLVCKFVARIPFILHYHSLFTVPLHLKPTDESFLRASLVVPRCDEVLCLSRVDARYFSRLGAPARYEPNPVDPALQVAAERAVRQDDGKTILWVGRFYPEKNPVDAIRVFARVRALKPEARLILVGDGLPQIKAAVRKAIRKAGLGDSVDLVGATTNAYAYYPKATVFLTTAVIEGYGMTSLEALTFSLPIVAYRMPNLELYRGNPHVCQVPQGDSEAAAQAICALLDDPSHTFATEDAVNEEALIDEMIERGSAANARMSVPRKGFDRLFAYYRENGAWMLLRRLIFGRQY